MGNDDFSRLELSLPAARANYRYFRSLMEPETKLLVLVKANAYGHGAVEFAGMMQLAGADYLAVALPIEGMELRKAGISLPIMVLTSGTDFFEEIISYRMEPSIPNLSTLKALVEVLKAKNLQGFPIHIKLDTGMHRLGFMSSELPELFEYLNGCPYVSVLSCFSHLAAAEDPGQDEFTLGQIKMFIQNATALDNALGYKTMWHILNSAGIERFPQYQFDMVRLGIGIYGISSRPSAHLEPVASFKVKVLQIKQLLPSDGTIGYGRLGLPSTNGTTIATIPCGYADGINRHLGKGKVSFCVNGHRAPTIGNICMDMCMLDVTGIDCKVGDTVTIFGKEPEVTELADILGTIPYEIFTSIPRRIERIVVRD